MVSISFGEVLTAKLIDLGFCGYYVKGHSTRTATGW
jgi:hypothetical protein